MHNGAAVKRRRRVPKSRARENGARGGRPPGAKQQILDAGAYFRFLAALGPGGSEEYGDLKAAAAKIRAAASPNSVSSLCHRLTLWRHVKALKEGETVRITQVLLAQMQRAAEREGPATLSAFHRATLSEIMQERMRMYFKWLESFRPYWDRSLAYRGVKSALFERYNERGQVIWKFRDWMRKEGIRPSLQEIVIWRILAPLIEHHESGGIELTWCDFVDRNEDEAEDDSELIKFLEAGVAWQTLYLERRGNDVHRAHRSTVSPSTRPPKVR